MIRLLFVAMSFIVLPTEALCCLSFHKLTRTYSTAFRQRVEADPSFAKKSVTELILAAATQLSAEWNRRGDALIVELDFVIAGVLTAMVGKYFTMWRVAPTLMDGSQEAQALLDSTMFGISVPNNAFQSTMLDGLTIPSLHQRILSFIAPMSSLFRAGVVASAIGYGLTGVLISLRAYLKPSYVAATRNVNVLFASLYTGVFMALISNLRYQLLQGIIEPSFTDKLRNHSILHSLLTFVVRFTNGYLGSILAILGMRILGLQRLK